MQNDSFQNYFQEEVTIQPTEENNRVLPFLHRREKEFVNFVVLVGGS